VESRKLKEEGGAAHLGENISMEAGKKTRGTSQGGDKRKKKPLLGKRGGTPEKSLKSAGKPL